MSLRTILFDLDGTLVQTREAAWQLFRQTNSEFDLSIDTREQFFGAANGTVSVRLDGFETIPNSKNAARDGDTDICEAPPTRNA